MSDEKDREAQNMQDDQDDAQDDDDTNDDDDDQEEDEPGDNLPTLYIDGLRISDARDLDGESADLDDIERVQLEFDTTVNGAQTEADERAPLGWLNSATIHLERAEDSVTVLISVGDPRGAFGFTVRRLRDGRLIMHTPYPGESMPHMDLTEINPGTYEVK